MSESYVINEKRELILDRVKEFIYQNGGVVKKSQLNELGIDYRRILDFVEKGPATAFPSAAQTSNS